MDNTVYQSLVEKGKAEDKIFDVAHHAYHFKHEIEDKGALKQVEDCFGAPRKNSSSLGSTFSDNYRTTSTPSEKCFKMWEQVEQIYEDYLVRKQKAEEEEQKAEEKARQEEIKRLKRLKKKSGGKDFCQPNNIVSLLQQRNLPRDCMFKLDVVLFNVLQQIKDGTLIHIYQAYGIPDTYLIEKNKIDGDLVDGAVVPGGIFMNVGTYQYTNTLGAQKTIYRLRRIE